MQNIKRGIAIFGSAGSGKTESGFVPILKHAGERNIPCLCYDYKNGEITEIAHYLFSEFYDKTSNYYTTFTNVLGPGKPFSPEVHTHRTAPSATNKADLCKPEES